MARRRAVDKSETRDVQGKLPFLYTSITPITPEQHGDLRINPIRSFDFARHVNAVPITADEFPQALRDYPIVFTAGDTPTPLALVGLRKGMNDHVDAEGNWSKGAYVPAYLRRYPFLLVKEKTDSDRQILCADMSSMQFTADGEALLTDAGEQTPKLADILAFATRYETSVRRTAKAMAEAAKLGLFQPSTVNLSKGKKTARIEGFSVISEEKLRELDDATLAGLARRGVLSLFTAHHMSLANFSAMGALE